MALLALTLGLLASSCALSPSQSSTSSTETSPSTSYMPPSNSVEARVSRVIDGDTIEVSEGGKTYTVGYLGVTAPAPNEPFGAEASLANAKLVEGKTVKLEKDVSDVDGAGNLLRYVYVGDVLVNAEMMRLGYARALTAAPDTKYRELFQSLEQGARKARKGIWVLADLTPTTPGKPTIPTEVTVPPPRN